MKYGYYPGCSLHSTASEYDASFRETCNSLGLDIEEIKDWVCCGTSPAHSSSRLLATALPIKSLSLAEQQGITDLAVPCASCFTRLKTAVHNIREIEGIKEKVDEIIGYSYKDEVKVRHPLDIFLNDIGREKISQKATRDMSGLKVACYYGCLLTRPPEIVQFDVCEYPMSMDKILSALGIKTLDWSYKTECCGMSFSLTRTDIVIKLTHNILEEARAVGAEAVSVACPLCHSNLDTRQAEIEKEYKTKYGLPIFYFTQLMGLAFGVSPEKLALRKHLVDPMALLEQKQII
jgi:heterodisulfide reductase subunit B